MSCPAVGDGCWELVVEAMPPPDAAVDAGRAMIQTTCELFTSGPTDAEHDHAVAVVLESARGRDAEIGAAMDAAIGELVGSGVKPFDPGAVQTVTSDQVVEFLQGLAMDVLY